MTRSVFGLLVFVLATIPACSSLSEVNFDTEPRVHVVEIVDFRYTPSNIKVQVGDKVRWINKDVAPHTATAKDESWDSGLLRQGESWELVVTKDTSLDYFCVYHPGMTATISLELKSP